MCSDFLHVFGKCRDRERPFFYKGTAHDNRVLTAILDGVVTGRISLNGASRDEIIRIFQAVGGQAQEEQQSMNPLRRFDY